MNNADDTNIPLEQLGRLSLNEGDIDALPIPPIFFDQGELHLHDHNIVIQNGGKRNRNLTSTPGSEVYTEESGG